MSNDLSSRHSSRNERPHRRRAHERRTTDREVVQSDELSSTSGARMIKSGHTASFDRVGRQALTSSPAADSSAAFPRVAPSSNGATRNASSRDASSTSSHRPVRPSRTGKVERVNVGHTGQFTTVTAGQTGEFARIPSGESSESVRGPGGRTSEFTPVSNTPTASTATGGFTAVRNGSTGAFASVPAERTGGFNRVPLSANDRVDDFDRIPTNDASFAQESSSTSTNTPKVASYGNDNNAYRPYQVPDDAAFRGFHAAPDNGATGSMTPIYVKPQHSHKRKKTWPRVVAAVAIVLAVVFGGFFGYQQLVYAGPITATVNGETMTLEGSERTIDGLLDNGIVQVAPGNFIAVDNSILEEGNGTRATAVINEKQTEELGTHIMEGDVVVVSSGADIMEGYSDSDPIVVPASSERVGPYGALHIFLPGQDGEKVTRTGSTSGITVETQTKETINERLAYYNVNSNGEKVIALTFDDGPNGATTDEILDILKANGAKATFYTIGANAQEYPDQLKRAAAEGHEIATHTWDHAAGSGKGVSLDLMSTAERQQEVEKGLAIIEELTGKDASEFFRSPGGNFSQATADDLKGLISGEIGWNIDTEDWTRPGVEAIVSRILRVKPGEVILMHDGGGDRSQTVAALREALPQLKEQGYKFITISELVEQYPYQG